MMNPSIRAVVLKFDLGLSVFHSSVWVHLDPGSV